MRGVLAAPRSVGTRGGVGRLRGPCACPGWSAPRFPDRTQVSPVMTRTSRTSLALSAHGQAQGPCPSPVYTCPPDRIPLVPTARTLLPRLSILVVNIHYIKAHP